MAPSRRLPAGLVIGASLTGSAVLMVLCALSAVNWSQVDPFRNAGTVSGWSYLCWACYAITTAWPVLLIGATAGYREARRTQRTASM